MDVRALQERLLSEHEAASAGRPLPQLVREAFLATPRHHFVKRYREPEGSVWHELGADGLERHLEVIYRNAPLVLVGDDDAGLRVTISQPGFVLHALDILDLQPGHRVLELGTGSGWHAAIAARIVGPRGTVVTIEIREDMVAHAREMLAASGVANVTVVHGDGLDAVPATEPFDRVLVTAGAPGVPGACFELVARGGLLLIPLKGVGVWDRLLLLRRARNHFVSELVEPAGFVPMTGRLAATWAPPRALDEVPEWTGLSERLVARRPFYWSGRGRRHLDGRTGILRDYLALHERGPELFRRSREDRWGGDDAVFGLWSDDRSALVLAIDDELLSFGSREPEDRLMRALHAWVELGMPGPESYRARVYPANVVLDGARRLGESQIVWELG